MARAALAAVVVEGQAGDDRPPSSTPLAGPVLQVVTSTDRRGAEVAATQLDHALRARGRSVETVALWPGSAGRPLELATLGRRRRDPRAAAALVARARGSSILVGHGSATLPFGALAATIARTPFVYRSIGDPAYWASTSSRRARVRTALGRARLIVALWPAAADTLRRLYGLSADRIAVIPTGVAADAFGPTAPDRRPDARRALNEAMGIALDPERTLVAYIGALSAEKDPLLAIEAVATKPGLQMVVAGDGPLRAAAARAARAGGDRIWVVGPVADPAAVLGAADVVVLTSQSEGIPGVAIEAGLAGLPVVATAVGGIPEVVVDRETGVLVSERSAGVLADALWSVVTGDGAAMGAAARRRCTERFSLDVVAAAWGDLFDRLTTTVPR